MKNLFTQKKKYRSRLEHPLVTQNYHDQFLSEPLNKWLTFSEWIFSIIITATIIMVPIYGATYFLMELISNDYGSSDKTKFVFPYIIIMLICAATGHIIYKLSIDYFIFSRANDYLESYIAEKTKQYDQKIKDRLQKKSKENNVSDKLVANFKSLKEIFSSFHFFVHNKDAIITLLSELKNDLEKNIFAPFQQLPLCKKPKSLKNQSPAIMDPAKIDAYVVELIAYETYRLKIKKFNIDQKIIIDQYINKLSTFPFYCLEYENLCREYILEKMTNELCWFRAIHSWKIPTENFLIDPLATSIPKDASGFVSNDFEVEIESFFN